MSVPTIAVTGAGRGIGLSIVNALLKATSPETVIIAIDVLGDSLDKLKSSEPKRLEVIIGSVADRSTSERLAEVIKARDGRLDTLILNAGVLRPVGKVAEVDVEEVKRLFDVNFFALWHSIQLTIGDLRRNKGKIIMTTSGVTDMRFYSWIAYSCSKAAMNTLSNNLALEEPDVPTVCISPGIADTGIQVQVRNEHQGDMEQKQYEWMKKLHEDGKLVHPDRIAPTYVNLALKGVPQDIIGKMVEWDDERIPK